VKPTKEQKAIMAAQVQAFREELPQVQVLMPDGTILPGLTQGRKEQFCSVSVELAGTFVQVGQWAWESIAGAFYGGRPVRA
jgi:hypothetical protein